MENHIYKKEQPRGWGVCGSLGVLFFKGLRDRGYNLLISLSGWFRSRMLVY